MKYLLYILCICLLGFTCKKAEVRKGIEGLWKIDKIEYNWNYPDNYTGTFEFENCPKKTNKTGECIVIKRTMYYNYYLDTTFPERTQNLNYKIGKRGKTALIGKTAYKINLTENKLILDEIIESRVGKETITLSRQ